MPPPGSGYDDDLEDGDGDGDDGGGGLTWDFCLRSVACLDQQVFASQERLPMTLHPVRKEQLARFLLLKKPTFKEWETLSSAFRPQTGMKRWRKVKKDFQIKNQAAFS